MGLRVWKNIILYEPLTIAQAARILDVKMKYQKYSRKISTFHRYLVKCILVSLKFSYGL